ncbi:predicted protein [Plenodomus lingam JN3]|uniref:Predicted protein n=1 Tax=Leptosphaeria maculans (strain JN3 / isolate v23.1.3 / race Av1-4-5-6-7-8) TaxID=985895 RepID=E5R581_LEPMJ|nr:predicted protein [Plenodomus lingam JN3]CBX92051.1 predicted protein [Plenodomus lingam JN3]
MSRFSRVTPSAFSVEKGREADPIVHVSATCGTRRTFRWRTGASIDIRTYGAFSMSRKGCTCSATFCRHYITLGSTSRSSPITFRISCHLMQTVTCTPTNALPKFRIQQSTAAVYESIEQALGELFTYTFASTADLEIVTSYPYTHEATSMIP